MENIQLKNEDGNLIVDFDGTVWEIFLDYDYDELKILSHDMVIESPFYLYQLLENLENSAQIINKLSQKSAELKELFDNFFSEMRRLESRIILVEKTGHGILDEFVNRISLSGNPNVGFTIEETIEDDFSHDDFKRNAFGEVVCVIAENIFDANEFYDAMQEITSDERWSNNNWTWEEIFSHIKPRYPKLEKDLKQIVEKRGIKVNQSIKNEFYYFKRIESYSNAQKFDLALECANEAIEDFPFCELLYATRGEIYFSKYLIDEAIKDYETAIQLGMEEKLLLNNLGLCYGIKRQYARAIECLSRAIELGNENINTYLARAKVFRKIGEIDKALLDEAKVAKLGSEEIDSEQEERCEVHNIKLEIKESRKYTGFVERGVFSYEDIYFREKLNEAENLFFPNTGLLIPNTQRQDTTDNGYYFFKYWVCSECIKEKTDWITKNKDIIYANYKKERCDLESDFWQRRKRMAELLLTSNEDFMVEAKREVQSILLEEGNSDAWVDFAGNFLKNRSLTENETNKIRDLAEKKDFENLREFVLGLSSPRIFKLKALFNRLVSILRGKK